MNRSHSSHHEGGAGGQFEVDGQAIEIDMAEWGMGSPDLGRGGAARG